jgi:hypothetical protein
MFVFGATTSEVAMARETIRSPDYHPDPRWTSVVDSLKCNLRCAACALRCVCASLRVRFALRIRFVRAESV